MAKVKITGHASGSGVFTITAPNSNTDRTITLPDASVTLGTDATKLPLAGGALTGAVTTNSTFDGRDVAADGVLATNALPKAGGTVTGTITSTHATALSIISANNAQGEIAFGDPEDANIGRIAYNHPGNFLATVVNATERMRIHSNGVTSIPAGVALGVGTANTASNVLNDYEEGTWTPALASNTTSCSMGSVYTSHYTKIGNVVKLYTSFDIDSSANPATGVLRFTGFPFALKTLGEGSFLISLYYNYKVAPMVFMSKGGYTYYTNTTVNGNNLRNLTETIGQSTTNVMGMQFSYLTDA